jgi:hypothetical protein
VPLGSALPRAVIAREFRSPGAQKCARRCEREHRPTKEDDRDRVPDGAAPLSDGRAQVPLAQLTIIPPMFMSSVHLEAVPPGHTHSAMHRQLAEPPWQPSGMGKQ